MSELARVLTCPKCGVAIALGTSIFNHKCVKP